MAISGLKRFRSSSTISMWICPLGDSAELECFRFLDPSAGELVMVPLVDWSEVCPTGFTCIADVLRGGSSSSSESADMETSEAESSLSIIVVSISAGTWRSLVLGMACAGDESAEESADVVSEPSEDASLDGDSIVVQTRGYTEWLDRSWS